MTWYIIRSDGYGNVMYYAGSDQWTSDYTKRYIWHAHKPVNHPVFNIYADCEIIAQLRSQVS